MEEKKHTEQPVMKQEERQLQSVVISSGLIIQSKLNPAAKEFFPSHVTRRNQMFQEIIKETKSSEEILERMQNDFTESASSRVRDCGLINFSEKVEPKKIATKQIESETIVKIEQHDSEEAKNIDSKLNADIKFLMNKTAIDDNERLVFKNEKSAVNKEEIVQKRELLKDKDINIKDIQNITRNVDDIVNDKVCGDCLTVSEEKKEEKRELEIEAVCEKNQLPQSKTAQQTEDDDDMAAIIKKIEEEINADENKNLPKTKELDTAEPLSTQIINTADMTIAPVKIETTGASKTLGTAKTVGTIKAVETVTTVETAKAMEIAKTIEAVKTKEIAKVSTTVEVAPKIKAASSLTAPATIVEAKIKEKGHIIVAKEQVNKTIPVKKEGGLRKISKIALSSIKKTSSSTSSHSTASTNSTNASTVSGEKPTSRTTTSSNMSRTKRISESLHNLSSTFKSKTDIKTAEVHTTKTTQRSTTTIPKSAVRSRTLLNKTSDTNGLKKETSSKVTPAKDAISLRSTSSTEKSVTSKSSFTPSTHSSSSKTLHSKISTTSTKSSDSKSSTSSKNSKDSSQKLPRGTVASSLRQTEAQKVS